MYPFTTLDVFTTKRFGGNPLAVVTIPSSLSPPSQATKQLIAREFNYSETVFLHEAKDNSSPSRKIDIFTTDAELPFAGHPTIGTACLLLRESGLAHIKTLITKAGPIQIEELSDDGGVRASIPHDVHIHTGRLGSLPAVTTVKLGFGDEVIRQAELAAPPVSIVKGMTFLMIQLPSLAHLRKVDASSSSSLAGLEGLLDEGPWRESFVGRYYYVITGDGRSSVRTRMIVDKMEDPATGSAACALASYLALEEQTSAEKTTRQYNITQGVEMGRQSDISVEVVLRPGMDSNPPQIESVYLGGSSVVVMKGSVAV